ncbi:PREDICTED: uncharacterized protein LOC109153795 [Ipomoea nil]|uniref:uncharacterized protein LOC109153795 n=1 Tax=Ipomoea nil TaxID=35883 RepID=UPI000901EEEC|nr:PREDICTED: uncharacterized protein LOC109153795 [Ipomoea nil]
MPFYNSDSVEPLIVVIQCCRAKVVGGEVRITSSYDATKLWFNEDWEEFKEFKSNMKAQGTPMRSLSTGTLHSNSTGLSDFNNASVIVTNCHDIKKVKQDGDYYVAAEILGLDFEDGWYYLSCLKLGCNKKLKEQEGTLFCTKCKKSCMMGTVRYKVVVIALDKSGDAPMLLWDREVTELVGIPASILYAKYKELDVEVPPELDAIVGMKMLFKINFKLAQKMGPNYPFNVVRVVRDEHLLKTYADRFVEHEEQDLMSRMIEEETNTDAVSGEDSIGVEVNSPATVQPSQKEGEDNAENAGAIKRSLLDEFSSSKTKMPGAKVSEGKRDGNSLVIQSKDERCQSLAKMLGGQGLRRQTRWK